MNAPRSWLVLEARLPEGAPDDGRLSEGLLVLGGRAVQEGEDGWLVTHLEAPADGGPSAEEFVRQLEERTGLPGLEVRLGHQPHEDWSELWKRGLAPRRVGRRFVVTPSWCEPEAAPDDEVLVLDPGMAFGNAEHGTTRGCLRLLEDTVETGERLLDVGAGSGILAIAAARLGAERVVALESDPWAVEPARENVGRNGVEDRVEVRLLHADVEALRALGPVDGMVANIEAGILTALLPGLAGGLVPGGWLIVSGILDTQLEGLLQSARAQGLALESVDADGEWRSARLRLEFPGSSGG